MRHGAEDGSVTLDGRRVGVHRPWVRATDGSSELSVPAYDLLSSTELLDQMAMAKMMAKLSTRRYRAGLEPVGTKVEATARSTSKSAVSRRFVEATETALAELLAGDLSGLDLVALMVDGVHFADRPAPHTKVLQPALRPHTKSIIFKGKTRASATCKRAGHARFTTFPYGTYLGRAEHLP